MLPWAACFLLALRRMSQMSRRTTVGAASSPRHVGKVEGFVSGDTVSIAITGAGGAGVMTAAQMLLDAAAKAGLYRMPEVPTCCRNRGRKSPLSNA